MRELERDSSSDNPFCLRLAVVGRGRLGSALAPALRRAGYEVSGPLGRGADGGGSGAVLLCVPDGEIAAAASRVAPGPLVGHCSGATPLTALGDREAFGLHPLMTVAGRGAAFAGAGAAIAGTTARAVSVARELALALGMRPTEIADADRTAYHAAASVASNFLITLEDAAERILSTAAAQRDLLVPLVRATVENWSLLGPERALTGPVARGDEATVAAQRAAVAERTPDLLPLFDVLTASTRALARRSRTAPPAASRTEAPAR